MPDIIPFLQIIIPCFSAQVTNGAKDFKMWLNRTHHLLDVENQIWEGKFYSTSKVVVQTKFEDLKAFVSNFHDKDDILSSEIKGTLTGKFIRVMPIKEYAAWMQMEFKDDRVKNPFVMTRWEEQIFPFTSKVDSIPSQDPEYVKKMGALYIRYLKLFDKSRAEEIAFDADTFKTTVTKLSQAKEITMTQMDVYLRNRHDYYAEIVLSHYGYHNQKLDMKVKDIWECTDSEKTPDFITETSPGNFDVYEFAVTNGSPRDVMMTKRDKYDLLTNIALVQKVKINFYVYVYDATNFRSYIFKDSRELISKDDIDFSSLNEIIWKVESLIPGFRTMHGLHKEFHTAEKGEAIYAAKQEILVLYMSMLKPVRMGPSTSLTLDPSLDLANQKITDIREDKFYKRVTREPVNNNLMKDLADHFITNLKSPDIKVCPVMKHIISTSMADVTSSIREKLKSQVQVRENYSKHHRTPKIFKFPLGAANTIGVEMPDWAKAMGKYTPLNDGTCAVSHEKGWNRIKEEMDEDSVDAKRAGIGIAIEDVEVVEETMKKLFAVFPSKDHDKDWLECFKSTLAFDYIKFMELVATEVLYLEERRMAFNTNKSVSVFKKYGSFSMMIHYGGKIKKDAQINIRIMWADKDKELVKEMSALMRTMVEVESYLDAADGYTRFESKWFTLSMADLNHYSTLVGRTSLLMTYLQSKYKENQRKALISEDDTCMSPVLTVPLMILMEHKRGTSSSNQLNRYLVHGYTAYLSDKQKLSDEIFAEPIRTIMQSYCCMKQATWCLAMSDEDDPSAKYRKQLLSEDSKYDQFFLPSFYDHTKKIEFAQVMDEIYYSNLFDQSHGFKGHREKQIMAKMEKIEKAIRPNYLNEEVGKNRDFKEFFDMKDNYGIHSPDFVKTMTINWLNKNGSKQAIQDAIFNAFNTTLAKVVKMTKSLVSGPTPFTKVLEHNDYPVKETVFMAVMDKFKELDEAQLWTVVQNDKMLAAIFSTFAKDQFGSSREILVQAIHTRLYTCFWNAFFESLCKSHPKDMTTKDKDRAPIQSDTTEAYRQDFLKSTAADSEHFDIPWGINGDASKWAQSMVMEQFADMIAPMDLGDFLSCQFLNTLRAYMTKICFAPASLVNKKAAPETEKNEDVRDARMRMVDEGFVVYISGMGQGNFQHASSFYHCLVDDARDILIADVLKTMGVTQVKMVTMLSSDDSTKFGSIRMRKDQVADYFPLIVTAICEIYTVSGMLANIHVNWKKTAFQLIISEFNSLFSIGKRVCMASIKEIYNCMSIVDLTYPDRAVKEAISQIRPLFTSGCYKDVIEHALALMREYLIKWYSLTEMIPELLKKFDLEDEHLLPYHLGFIPIYNLAEMMVHGPDIHMFNSKNSDTLNEFYKRLYSAETMLFDEEALGRDKEDLITGRFYIQLPLRLDKKVVEMKEKHFGARDRDTILSAMNLNAFNNLSKSHLSTHFQGYMDEYLFGVSKRYEFSDSYRQNSLIRALQLPSGSLLIQPLHSQEMKQKKVEREKTEKEANLSARKFRILDFEKEDLDEIRYTVRDFVETVFKADPMKSNICLFSNLEQVMKDADEIQTKLEGMKKVVKASRHTKKRLFRYYATSFYEAVSSKEIFESLMSRTTHLKKRYSINVARIAEMLNVALKDLLENPLTTLVNAFSESERPLMDAKLFLDRYCDFSATKPVEMVTEYPVLDNRMENFLNWYQYRTDPRYVLVSTDLKSSDLFDRQFSSLISISTLQEAKKAIPDDFSKILTQNDHWSEVAMKLVAQMDESQEVEYPEKAGPIRTTFPNKDAMFKVAFTDWKSMIKINETKDFMMITFYSSSGGISAKLKEVLITQVTQYKVEKKGLRFRVWLKDERRERSMSSEEMLNSIEKNTFKIRAFPAKFKLELKHTADRWYLMARMADLAFKVHDARLQFYTSEEYKDKISDDSAMALASLSSETSLREIDAMMTRFGLGENITVPFKKAAGTATAEVVEETQSNTNKGIIAAFNQNSDVYRIMMSSEFKSENPSETTAFNSQLYRNLNIFGDLLDLDHEFVTFADVSTVPLGDRKFLAEVFFDAINRARSEYLFLIRPMMQSTGMDESAALMSITFTIIKKDLGISDYLALIITGAVYRDCLLWLEKPAALDICNLSRTPMFLEHELVFRQFIKKRDFTSMNAAEFMM